MKWLLFTLILTHSSLYAVSIDALQTGQDVSFYEGDDTSKKIGIQRAFDRVDEQGVVVDKITNLKWIDTKESHKKMNYKEATNYCDSLSVGGYKNWRIPTRYELHSIVSYEGAIPATFSSFSHTNASIYWTSSSYTQDSSKVWAVSFYNALDSPVSEDKSFYVRCVRK